MKSSSSRRWEGRCVQGSGSKSSRHHTVTSRNAKYRNLLVIVSRARRAHAAWSHRSAEGAVCNTDMWRVLLVAKSLFAVERALCQTFLLFSCPPPLFDGRATRAQLQYQKTLQQKKEHIKYTAIQLHKAHRACTQHTQERPLPVPNGQLDSGIHQDNKRNRNRNRNRHKTQKNRHRHK